MTNNRRDFLKSTSAALAMSALSYNKVVGANETIRVAVTGLNGRGRNHVESFAELGNVEVVAICDTDERVLDRTVKDLKKHLASPVKRYVDYREMMDDKDIDVSSIATPNRWHAIMGIWACQAGKDAYVEKPCSHNVLEGQKLVEAQKKYNRIVAHGTQSRSVEAYHEAMDLIKNGFLGEVYYAKGFCYKWRDTIGHTPSKPVPEGVHYDLWEGPAPDKPFTENRHHYNWHWQWDYGNGDIGNQGVHQMDVARWGLNVGLPELCSAIGGHFMFDDDQETPNTMVSTFKYKETNQMFVFEVRHWITNQELGGNPGNNVVGNMFLGSKGMMVVPSYSSYKVFLGKDLEEGPSGSEGGNHWENFIDAVVSRDRSKLHADVLEGHLSSSLCHLANAAYLTESTLQFDPKTERCTNNKEADEILQGKARGYRTPFSLPENI